MSEAIMLLFFKVMPCIDSSARWKFRPRKSRMATTAFDVWGKWCYRSSSRVILPGRHGQQGMYFGKGVVQSSPAGIPAFYYFFCLSVWRRRSLPATQAWRTSSVFLFWIAVVSACWEPLWGWVSGFGGSYRNKIY